MYCPKCGTLNAEGAQVCASCGQVLSAPAPAGEPVEVKVSGMAIAAFVLGLLGLFTCGLTVIPAIIVGIIALAGISRSGGRRTGRGFAIAGICVASVSVLFLLMGILMPALARVRQLAFRMTCGTNLAGIGKAMLIYANDYEDEFPLAGGRATAWGEMPQNGWIASSRMAAYNTAPDGKGGAASITSCFYLLVKYAEVTPKSFICKGDHGTTEFMLSDYSRDIPPGAELIQLWDFGPPSDAYKHCSYAYHMPFSQYAVTTSNEPSIAVAADRNPWIPSPSTTLTEAQARWRDFKPDVSGLGYSEQAGRGNAVTHQGDGQNVLFLDSHVEFAKRAFCGLEGDNIYTISSLKDNGDSQGVMPTAGPTCLPKNRKDSLLVHDPDTFGTLVIGR